MKKKTNTRVIKMGRTVDKKEEIKIKRECG